MNARSPICDEQIEQFTKRLASPRFRELLTNPSTQNATTAKWLENAKGIVSEVEPSDLPVYPHFLRLALNLDGVGSYAPKEFVLAALVEAGYCVQPGPATENCGPFDACNGGVGVFARPKDAQVVAECSAHGMCRITDGKRAWKQRIRELGYTEPEIDAALGNKPGGTWRAVKKDAMDC